MKRLSLISATLVLLTVFACRKQEPPPPGPERELSVPEKVEKEMTDVVSKDWKSLTDTLNYFNSNMLLKGRIKGTAPDGVYYEMDMNLAPSDSISISFKIQDSLWVKVSGSMNPVILTLTALGTDMVIKEEQADSCSLSVSNLTVIAPINFLLKNEHTASLAYKGERVGWLTREIFENPDYSTGTYVVIHYFNDPRTFALFDNGLEQLLKNNLKYVFR